MSGWNRIDAGSGEPLVLLHGCGASARSWAPVIERLARNRRVIAFDFPGFGRTPAVAGAALSSEWAVEQITAELSRLGISTPVDIAGNSMGGWMALEAARQGIARSCVAIAPAGLWGPGGMPRLTRAYFTAAVAVAKMMKGPARTLLRFGAARSALFALVLKHPARMPYEEALGMLADTRLSAAAVEKSVAAAGHTRFTDGRAIQVPVTVAFGTHDHFVPARSSQRREELPAHTRWLTLSNCGHVPMWDDPDLIAATILEGCRDGVRDAASIA